MDGVADTVEHQLTFLLPDTGGQPRYFRFQISLPPGMGAMDNASPDHIADLKREARQLIDSDRAKLDELCALLNTRRWQHSPEEHSPREHCLEGHSLEEHDEAEKDEAEKDGAEHDKHDRD